MSFNIFPANRARELVEASEKTLRGRLEEVSKKIEALAAEDLVRELTKKWAIAELLNSK